MSLFFGASYGALFASKLLFANHNATLVCLPDEAELINAEGIRVRMPVRHRADPIEIDSRSAPGRLAAKSPRSVDPAGFDLAVFAMQEPQYSAEELHELLDQVARAGVPSLSIMNMPPLPFLTRIPAIDTEKLAHCYRATAPWSNFEPTTFTLASPDAQAYRPPDEAANVLQVSLPTNFKVAPFGADVHTDMLRRLADDIDRIRYDLGSGESCELPVKLRLRESLFVPLAKWAMLLTGNYRCIGDGSVRSINEAVHDDLEAAATMYGWVCDVCKSLGAGSDDMVPFEKYANAAKSLVKPSSVARALDAGAVHVERVDLLVQAIAAQKGLGSDMLDLTVSRVDAMLERNRDRHGSAV